MGVLPLPKHSRLLLGVMQGGWAGGPSPRCEPGRAAATDAHAWSSLVRRRGAQQCVAADDARLEWSVAAERSVR
jgi:hypothetical protein